MADQENQPQEPSGSSATKPKRETDPEVRLIASLTRQLSRVSPKSRSRIVSYLYERYEDPEESMETSASEAPDEDIFSE